MAARTWAMRRGGAVVALIVIALTLGLVMRCRSQEPTSRGSSSSAAPGKRPVTANPARPQINTLPRGSIAGVVRDVRGAPIAGARVCARGSADDISPALLDEPRCATTGDAGRYALDELWAAQYDVVAGAPTYRPAQFRLLPPFEEAKLTVAPGQAVDGIDLVLAAGGVQLTGIVSDVNGGPIARARVLVVDAAQVTAPPVDTDDSGKFAVWSGPGPARIDATAEGYRTGGADGSAPGSVSIELEPASTVTGVVVDDATGAPIEGAYVQDAEAYSHDITGPDGTFKLADLYHGRLTLTATTSHGKGQSASVRVALGGRVDNVEIRLLPALRIHGRVMIAGSPPRPCPQPSAWFDMNAAIPPFARLVDGTVEQAGVAPGTYQVVGQCVGFLDSSSDEIIVGDVDVEHVWLVSPGATIKGTITTRSGAPVPNAIVSLDHSLISARTDASGHYATTALRAGKHDLSVTIDGVLLDLHASIELAEGATVAHDITLEELGAVHVRVVDTAGKPVARLEITVDNATIEGRSPVDVTARGTTDDGGELTFPRVPVGRYHLHDKAHVVTVQAGRTTTARLVLPARTGTVSGVVVGPDGAPVADAYVSVMIGDDTVVDSRLTRADGTFAITGLEEHPLSVTARDTFDSEVTQTGVAPGSTLRLQLPANAWLDGTIAGAPADTVIWLEGDGAVRYKARADPSGHFAFGEVPAAKYSLEAKAQTGFTAVPVELARGEKKHLDLAFGRYMTVSSRVVDAITKSPVADLNVKLDQWRDPGFYKVASTSDHNGRVTFTVVPGKATVAGYEFRTREAIATAATWTITPTTTELPPLLVYRASFDRWGETGVDFGLGEGACRGIVVDVAPNSPAAAAGIVRGDEISAIDGVEFAGNRCSVTLALLHRPPGKPIVFTRSNGTTVSITPVAGTAPER